MKTTIRSMLVAAVLATVSASAMAADEGIVTDRAATSVTEMMQRKHDHQLRAKLVAEGRWDEVRQLDENNAARLREEQENQVTKANEALTRGRKARGGSEVPLLNECDPEKLHL